MQCMKCGREIPAGDVFCQDCLRDMARYPVKPGTAVHIPKQPPAKRPQDRRSHISAERKAEILTRRVRILSWLLILAIAMVICLGALTLSLLQNGEEGPIIGQNYSSVEQTEGDR